VFLARVVRYSSGGEDNVTCKLRCFPAPERGDFSKNSDVLQLTYEELKVKRYFSRLPKSFRSEDVLRFAVSSAVSMILTRLPFSFWVLQMHYKLHDLRTSKCEIVSTYLSLPSPGIGSLSFLFRFLLLAV